MSKYIELEDTILWRTKIVSFNIDNINYIEKFNSKRIVVGLNTSGRYFVDASVDNLTKLYMSELIGGKFISENYTGMEVFVGIKSNEQMLTDIIIKREEIEGVKRNDFRRHKKWYKKTRFRFI